MHGSLRRLNSHGKDHLLRGPLRRKTHSTCSGRAMGDCLKLAAMKHVLIALLGLVVAVGCGTTPQGINQTSKVKVGAPIWEFETGAEVYSSPAIGSDGTVYVGSEDKKLYAINGKSGVKLWEFETGDRVISPPAIGPDGTVYVGSYDKKLYAIKTNSKGLAKSPWPMRGQNPQHNSRASKK